MKNTNVDLNDINMKHIKRFMNDFHPGKAYRVYEYKNFYTAGITDESMIIQPQMFTKSGAFPIPRSFASVPAEELKNPKLVYESGGRKDAKK